MKFGFRVDYFDAQPISDLFLKMTKCVKLRVCSIKSDIILKTYSVNTGLIICAAKSKCIETEQNVLWGPKSAIILNLIMLTRLRSR